MITHDTIDRLLRFDGQGIPVVSVYLGVDRTPSARDGLRSHAASLLGTVRPMAEDRSLEREARLSLRADIERIETAVGEERWKPGSVALFSCTGRGLFEEVTLPRTLRDRSMVDATPWMRPALAVLEEYHRTCAVLLDKGMARIWELTMDEMREVAQLRDPTLRKPDFAAWDAEYGVHHKAEELAKRHYRRVAAELDRLCRTDGFDLLVIGGMPYEIPRFVEALTRELRDRTIGTFNLNPETATQADVRASVDRVVDGYVSADEQRMVGELAAAVAADSSLAALGLEDCLWAGSVAAVDTLLVQEGAVVPAVVCAEGHWLSLSSATCPICGQPTRSTPDVIDHLVETVIDESGSVRHIRADSELRNQLVGARLRFPLPDRPQLLL